MNAKECLASRYCNPANMAAHGHIAREVARSVLLDCPRKPYDKETADSMYRLNDLGGLIEGDMDLDTDMGWMNMTTLRVLWNMAARLTRK